MQSLNYKKTENEANQFARSLLLPKKLVKEFVLAQGKIQFDDLAERLSSKAKVSIAIASIRLSELGYRY